MTGDFAQRYRGAVHLGHEQPAQDHLVEFAVGAAGEEAIQLNEELNVNIVAFGCLRFPLASVHSFPRRTSKAQFIGQAGGKRGGEGGFENSYLAVMRGPFVVKIDTILQQNGPSAILALGARTVGRRFAPTPWL